MQPSWDYTTLAATYDKRPDYSDEAIERLLAGLGLDPRRPLVDVGAGTGKLTVALARRGYQIVAVEPNDAMRELGEQNTTGLGVRWIAATGEATTLPDAFAQLAIFGSSFNVTDRPRALRESARILVPTGWFACLWNHRDLDDPLQSQVEAVIARMVPSYDYGVRREDQAEIIEASGLFGPVQRLEGRFVARVPAGDYLTAWRSHATLYRQAAGDARFEEIMHAISAAVAGHDPLQVPYTTRVWYAQRRLTAP